MTKNPGITAFYLSFMTAVSVMGIVDFFSRGERASLKIANFDNVNFFCVSN